MKVCLLLKLGSFLARSYSLLFFYYSCKNLFSSSSMLVPYTKISSGIFFSFFCFLIYFDFPLIKGAVEIGRFSFSNKADN